MLEIIKIKVSEQSNHEFKPDKNHAQILIDIASSSRSFEEAKKIIEESGVNIVETIRLSKNSILIKLNVMDMREIALN